MILTEIDIDLRVSQISGTHIKRNNLRRNLKRQSNDLVNEEIHICKGMIRDLRAMGAREEALRYWYSQVTNLEVQIL